MSFTIQSYTPYIQVIAAIYSSMLFENIINKFFWDRKFHTGITDEVKKVGVTLSISDTTLNDLQLKISQKNEKKRTTFSKGVNTYASIMLPLSIILLLLSGVQQQYRVTLRLLIGINNSFSLWCYHNFGVFISIAIAIPCIYFFVKGRGVTTRYLKRIHNKNENRLQKYYKDLDDIINYNKDTSNPEINNRIAKLAMQGEYNPEKLIAKIVDDLKKETVDDILKIFS